jgi:preprotein translocase subunit YajC
MDPLFLPLLVIAVLTVPLIMNARRQKRAMAQAQELQSSLRNGDRVMTTSGLYGTVVGSTDATTVDLEIAPGVRTTWLRAAIREKLTEDAEDIDESAKGGLSVADQPLPAPHDSARFDNS